MTSGNAKDAPRTALERVNDAIYRILTVVCAAFLAVMIVTVAYQVLARYVLEVSTPWAEDVAVYCFIWGVLLGTSLGIRDNTHLVADFFPVRLPWRWDALIGGFVYLMAVATGLAFLVIGSHYAYLGLTRGSYSMGFPMFYVYVSMPIAGAFMLLFLAEKAKSLWKAGARR